MSKLLDKLQEKPIPKTEAEFQILIPQIVDVGKEGQTVPVVPEQKIVYKPELFEKFNKVDILHKIRQNMGIIIKNQEVAHSMESELVFKKKPIMKKHTLKSKIKIVQKDGDDDTKTEIKDTFQTQPIITKPELYIGLKGPLSMVEKDDSILKNRFDELQPNVLIKTDKYYLNNREIFVNFINSLFAPYKEELKEMEKSVTCETSSDDKFNILTHQKIVRDYMNEYTPYRGLLIYHGLGSGKSCASIGIAEGLKTDKKILVMTPASLRVNYLNDLKNKCGNILYRKNQFWEFIDTERFPQFIEPISNALNLPTSYIQQHNGAWLVNMKKKPNFHELRANEKESLINQINEMMLQKYEFLNYNGLTTKKYNMLTNNNRINLFENKVVIIDEAHNFVSRIVNKIKRPNTLSMKLYDKLMSANNCKVILLTGTPIINYPNELGVLFNILRGYIQTFYLPLNVETSKKIDLNYLKSVLNPLKLIDYIDYRPANKTLVITRNPFGFVSNYKGRVNQGLNRANEGIMSNKEFIERITELLNTENIRIYEKSINIENFKALPDQLDEFTNYFITPQSYNIKNINMLRRRILGLTSYFRSAQEKLMPDFDPLTDLHVIKLEMSDFQFAVYESARIQERKLQKSANQKKKKNVKGNDIYDENMSTYRIFSRAFCNFVFPKEIGRPLPNKEKELDKAIESGVNVDLLDAIPVEKLVDNIDGKYDVDDIENINKEEQVDASYEQRIQNVLIKLEKYASQYLTPTGLEIYSPKFLEILNNLNNPTNQGLHLIYSQFRTLEGIGILKLVLEANGYIELKIGRNKNNEFMLNLTKETIHRPHFALYTGTETAEEKELLRNIYNSDWTSLPPIIRAQLENNAKNNFLGEICKVLMITASGAEGINLQNVRYVHITEPYWHPVRIQQVIGRARRICSHKNLPEELRNIKVFLYLMTLSSVQLKSDITKELRINDKSKLDNITPLTTDETLYEISNIKENINGKLLLAVKESAIDCAVNLKQAEKENLKCLAFGNVTSTKFSYLPSISNEENDKTSNINKKKIEWQAKIIKIMGKEYALRVDNHEIYDLESFYYAQKNPGVVPILLGKYIEDKDKNQFTFQKY
jgi:hypothetical protein